MMHILGNYGDNPDTIKQMLETPLRGEMEQVDNA
jgi:hypothetical protein